MPITGKVVEVNSQLENMPELVNQSPYESWIIKVQLDAPGDRSGLLTAEQYHSLVL